MNSMQKNEVADRFAGDAYGAPRAAARLGVHAPGSADNARVQGIFAAFELALLVPPMSAAAIYRIDRLVQLSAPRVAVTVGRSILGCPWRARLAFRPRVAVTPNQLGGLSHTSDGPRRADARVKKYDRSAGPPVGQLGSGLSRLRAGGKTATLRHSRFVPVFSNRQQPRLSIHT